MLSFTSEQHYSTQVTTLPTTYAWPVSSIEDVSDSFLDWLRLHAGLLWNTVPNDLRK